MKDTEIHNGLKNKEIRDFLSMSIVGAYSRKCVELNIKYDDSIDKLIQSNRNQILKLENNIYILETSKSVINLAKMNGWDEYDVSDDVIKTGQICRSFFGTEEEYNTFMDTNNYER